MASVFDQSGQVPREPTSPALIYLADSKKGRFAIRGSLDTVARRLGYVDAKTTRGMR